MITELLGLGGSGVLGAVFSMVSDSLSARREVRLEELRLQNAREARLNGQVAEYLQGDGFSTSPAYSVAFLCLTATYCACAIICFVFPNVELLTFNPDAEPRNIEFLFGLVSWSINSTKVYTISTGGVGYALLHPLAFQIGTVITGITPTRRRP